MAKFCPECGSGIIDSSLPLCSKCGAKLPTSPKQQPEQPSTYIPPVNSGSSSQTSGHQQVPMVEGTTKKRSTVEWIAICCGGAILFVFLAAFIAGMAYGGSSSTQSITPIQQTTVKTTPAIDPIIQIKNSAQNVPYDDLFRYNENYVGKIVKFRGEIIQIESGYGDNYIFRLATKNSQYVGYIDDVIYVNYKGTRYLEGDTIDVWAKVDGLETYTTVLGSSVTIPKITALHTELIKKASGSSSEVSVSTTRGSLQEISPVYYNTVSKYDQEVTLVGYSNTAAPEKDTQLITVVVNIENTGSDSLRVSDSDFVIIDVNGNQFDSFSKKDISYGWQDEITSSSLGIKRTIKFKLPNNIRASKLYYDFGSRNSGKDVATWSVG